METLERSKLLKAESKTFKRCKIDIKGTAILNIDGLLACLHVHFSELVLGSDAWSLLSHTQKRFRVMSQQFPFLNCYQQ